MKKLFYILICLLYFVSCNRLSEEELTIHKQKVTSGIANKKNDIDQLINNNKSKVIELSEKLRKARKFKIGRSKAEKEFEISSLETTISDLSKYNIRLAKFKKELDYLHNTYNFQSEPQSVLNELFTAAKTRDFRMMLFLADPYDENDSDVDRIGYSEALSPKQRMSIISMFENAKIIGEPRILENTAEIDFLYGRNADKKETMKLIRRNESWYLLSF
jgi:hypothetical protein